MTLSDVVLFITAYKRPAYLEQTLASWARARRIADIRSLVVALGPSAVEDQQRAVIDAASQTMSLDLTILPDTLEAVRSPGMHRAIGEALRQIHDTLRPAAVILTEEDVEVSDDVLEYFAWAFTRFAGDRQVLTVCAHDIGGQGWDIPGIGGRPGRADAAQDTVRVIDYFNPWCWGTWASRVPFLLEHWDWDATLGPHPMQHGYDWRIRHLVHGWDLRSVVPDASRSQNIGRDGGYYARPELFEQTLAASYRPQREPVAYRLEDGK